MSRTTGTLQDQPGGQARAAPTPEYAPGAQIAGRYRVIERLGRGASAVVYRVLDQAIGEEVAVKIIDDPEGGVARLAEEVRLARRVTHANVCRVFDLFEHRHGALLSMELVAGGTLAGRTGQPLPEAEARALVAQILDGLEAAHAAGLVHRDLKPQNVLVTAEGRVAITDFGVARPVVEVAATGEGRGAGTPAYMAPEQLRGAAVDGRADLYALGLITYELLAGHLPFCAPGAEPDLPAALRRLEADPPPPPGGALARGAMALLARDPAARPADAAAARRALGLDGAQPAPHPRRRAAWIAAAAGVATIAAAAGATALLAGGDTGPGRRDAPEQPELAVRALSEGEEAILEPPALSPDGSELVVASNRSGQFELWALSLGDGRARQLTRGGAGKHFPHFSGGFLYYLRDRGELYDLVRVPAASPAAEPELVIEAIGYAHVGASGAVVSSSRRLGDTLPATVEIRASTAPGATAVPLEHEPGRLRWAVMAPDGSRVAWLRRGAGDERAELRVADAATGRSRTVQVGVVAETGLAFAGDDHVLLFQERDGRRSLLKVPLDGGAALTLVADAARGTTPVPLPDGGAAYVVDSVAWGIWLREPEHPFRRLTFASDEEVMDPSWVPGRRALAWVAHHKHGPSQLRLVDDQGFTEVLARLDLVTPRSSVTVTADGAHAVYVSGDGLLAAPLDGTPPRLLARAPAAGAGLFSPHVGQGEGGLVTFVQRDADGHHAVFATPLAASPAGAAAPPHLVVDGAGLGYHSPDGTMILLSRDDAPTGVGLRRLDASGRPTGPWIDVAGDRAYANLRFHPATGELVGGDAEALWAIPTSPGGTRRRIADWPAGTRDIDRCVADTGGRIACALGVGRSALVVAESL